MKRFIDVMGVLLALPLALPLGLLTALCVRMFLGKPVLFAQERAGRGGQAFMLYKFRSMTDGRDASGQLLPDEQRLTGFGRFLRSSSLDELPELWNILRGDMSWVGPRPLPTRYVARYSARQRQRLNALPGLTGWAQVQGRNAVPWPERFEMDVWYVENRSTWLDLRIIWLTVLAVLTRRGISAEGEATMNEFTGQEKPAPQRDEW